MDLLVTYDVSTQTAEGRRRLRRVAQVCKNYGQRVQKSVFECTVTEVQMENLRHRLLNCMKLEEDSLRIYHFSEGQMQNVENHGIARTVDFEGPLIV